MHSWSHHRSRYSEPVRTTLIRTIAIALAAGTLLFLLTMSPGDAAGAYLQYWVSWVVSVLWFSFGGHWVEIIYLNHIRMSLPRIRWLETGVRLLVWYVGGCALFVGMKVTADWLGNSIFARPDWWHGGLLFIVVELIIHGILSALKRNSFWNGRG